jgi:phosphoribosylformylglycinamidine (FGAM) synthase-like amidotransferase family enzyme
MVVEYKTPSLKIGIVRFPGTNCEVDTYRWLQTASNAHSDIYYIDYREQSVKEGTHLVILPGGFSYGDRMYKNATGHYTMDPGVMAVNTPIVKYIINNPVNVLGICNGFQILTHAKLLKGELVQNLSTSFMCMPVHCEMKHWFYDTGYKNPVVMPIANKYGRLTNFNPDEVFLRYAPTRTMQYENGSEDFAAGLIRKQNDRLVIGLMPHPERCDAAVKKSLWISMREYFYGDY